MNKKNKNKWLPALLALAIWCALGSVAWGESTAKRIVTSEEIREGAEIFLLSHLNWKPEEMDIAVTYDGKDLILPEGELVLDYGMPVNSRGVGRIPLTVHVKVNDKFIRRLRVNSRVAIFEDVVRVVNSIKRGEIINASDVAVERFRSERLLKNRPNQMDEVVGQKATRNLRAGKIVNYRDVKKAPLVERGSRVIIVATKGNMKITAQGTVREEGFKNSIVKVVNLGTKKTIYAEVIDANTVEVKF